MRLMRPWPVSYTHLDDDALVDHHHRVELVFDLLGIDVLSVGAEEHVLDASADEEMCIRDRLDSSFTNLK